MIFTPLPHPPRPTAPSVTAIPVLLPWPYSIYLSGVFRRGPVDPNRQKLVALARSENGPVITIKQITSPSARFCFPWPYTIPPHSVMSAFPPPMIKQIASPSVQFLRYRAFALTIRCHSSLGVFRRGPVDTNRQKLVALARSDNGPIITIKQITSPYARFCFPWPYTIPPHSVMSAFPPTTIKQIASPLVHFSDKRKPPGSPVDRASSTSKSFIEFCPSP